MSAVLGSGEHRYRVVENWAKLPDGWEFMDVGAVAVDSKDRVYVFNRGEHPMVVFDRDGNFLKSWGEGVFTRPHQQDVGNRGHYRDRLKLCGVEIHLLVQQRIDRERRRLRRQ